MPEWFEAMTMPGKIAFLVGLLGGLAGLGSLVANAVMAKANRGMERSTARSVEVAEQATALTREAVHDQIETNRFARSARVGIMAASYRNSPEPQRGTDFDSFVKDVLGEDVPGVMELVLINEGAAPAFSVRAIAADYESRSIRDHRAWSPLDKNSQFASVPFASFPVLMPIESKTCEFAIRNRDEQGNPKQTLEFTFHVRYSDGLGFHTRSFEVSFFGTGLEWTSPGLIFERPWQADTDSIPEVAE